MLNCSQDPPMTCRVTIKSVTHWLLAPLGTRCRLCNILSLSAPTLLKALLKCFRKLPIFSLVDSMLDIFLVELSIPRPETDDARTISPGKSSKSSLRDLRFSREGGADQGGWFGRGGGWQGSWYGPALLGCLQGLLVCCLLNGHLGRESLHVIERPHVMNWDNNLFWKKTTCLKEIYMQIFVCAKTLNPQKIT